MNFPLFIARRLYSERGENNKVSKPALYIATTGVALGLAVMIISVCVILGFKHTIRDKVTGLGAHATVANFVSLHGSEQRPIDYSDSIRNVLKKTPGLKSMQSFAMTQGILKTDSDFMGVAYKGIAADYDTAFIHSCMTEGSIPGFSDKSSGNQILISKNIATKLRLKTGDRVFSYFINNGDIRVRRYTVAGIYQTNMTKFDESLCFCDLYSAVKLNGWSQGQVSGVELQLHDIANVPIAARYLVKNVNRQGDKFGETYSSETVYEMYPQIFSWLDLLDLNVWIILGLMICVSGITIISGLLIIILERTRMIGTLKAMGCRNRSVRNIFIWFAALVIGRGLILGDIIALGLVALQKYTKFVSLDASVYYVDYVPVEINAPLILLINAATLAICLLVFIGPSYIVSHINPVKTIKYE